MLKEALVNLFRAIPATAANSLVAGSFIAACVLFGFLSFLKHRENVIARMPNREKSKIANLMTILTRRDIRLVFIFLAFGLVLFACILYASLAFNANIERDKNAEAARSIKMAFDLCKIGKLHADQIRFERALSYFESSDILYPNYTTRMNLGFAYEQISKTSEAISKYQSAIDLSPSEPEGYLAIGDVLRDAGRYSEARTNYLAASRYIGPTNESYRFRVIAGLGIIDSEEAQYVRDDRLLRTNLFSSAVSNLSAALDIRGGSSDEVLIGKVLNNRANAYTALGEITRARMDAQRMLDIKRKHAADSSLANGISNFVRISFFLNDDYSNPEATNLLFEAKQHYQYRKDNRGLVFTHFNLGEIAFAVNHLDAAKTHYLTAQTLVGESGLSSGLGGEVQKRLDQLATNGIPSHVERFRRKHPTLNRD